MTAKEYLRQIHVLDLKIKHKQAEGDRGPQKAMDMIGHMRNRGNSMSFKHWNQFIELFKADQAARGAQRIRAETSTESSEEGGRQTRQQQKMKG